MIRQSIVLCALVLGLFSHAVAQDAERGEELAQSCAGCHGAQGQSENPQYPKLAGQNERYLIEQLEAYRSGARVNALMAGQASGLSDQDIADLAAYYAEQEPTFGAADADVVDLGESIYRAGIEESGVAACIACHGPNGAGNAPAGFPQIGGQHAAYTVDQLNKYANGFRAEEPSDNARMTDGETMMMRTVAHNLKDFEREAVAQYIQGLNPANEN